MKNRSPLVERFFHIYIYKSWVRNGQIKLHGLNRIPDYFIILPILRPQERTISISVYYPPLREQRQGEDKDSLFR